MPEMNPKNVGANVGAEKSEPKGRQPRGEPLVMPEDLLAELKSLNLRIGELIAAVRETSGSQLGAMRAIENKLTEQKSSHDAQLSVLQKILERQGKQDTLWAKLQEKLG